MVESDRRTVTRSGFDAEKPATAEIIYGMPAREYHADAAGPLLSQSLATLCDTRSAKHAWQAHPLLGGAGQWEYEPSKDDGTLIHSLVLEPDSTDIYEIDTSTITTKGGSVAKSPLSTTEGKAIQAAALASGKIPVLSEKLAIYKYKAKALRQRFEEQGFAFTGKSEVVIYWTEETPFGLLRCRARIDHLIVTTDSIEIYDVKTSQDASSLGQSRSCWEYGYDIQHASYTRAVGAVFPEMLGRIHMNFLFCELEKPYAVNPAPLDSEFQRIGEHRWERSRDRWAKCLRSGNWESYQSKPIAAPAWAKQREMGEE